MSASDSATRPRSDGRRTGWPALHRTAVGLGWLCTLIALLCLLARSIDTTNHWLLIAACAAPYAPALGLVAVVVLGLSRRRLGLVLAIFASVALAVAPARVLLARAPATAGGKPLTLLTFNMRLGQASATEVVAAVRQHQVDLLTLQEITPEELTRLDAAGLASVLPNRFEQVGGGGTGVAMFSRYPLTDHRSFPQFTLHVISARLTVPGGAPITAFSSHLAAPWPQAPDTWKSESASLGAVLAATSGDVVDAGDFNATSSLRPFRSLVHTGRMTDGAAQAGAVGLRTYPADHALVPPLLGIDHVLVRGVTAHHLSTLHLAGSDHRAVLATLTVPAAG